MPTSETMDKPQSSQSYAQAPKKTPRPFGSTLRRYKWDDLHAAEKEAVKDAFGLAATRSAVGLGVVVTIAALLSNARRGKPPIPPLLRYGSFTFFSLAGAYAGLMSGGPAYTHRILGVPNSRLADDLRTVMGDWQARLPTDYVDSDPHEPLPEGPVGTRHGKDEIIPRDPKEVRAEQRLQRDRERQGESKAN